MNIIWISDNVVLVDNKGKVTAIGSGTGVITVTVENVASNIWSAIKISAQCIVTVNKSSIEGDIDGDGLASEWDLEELIKIYNRYIDNKYDEQFDLTKIVYNHLKFCFLVEFLSRRSVIYC